MTLNEMEHCGKNFLSPQDVCGVLGCKPYSINQQAHADQSKLGFPVVVMGKRVRIPRISFIKYVKGEHMA